MLVVSAKNYSATGEVAYNDTPKMKQYWLVLLLKGNNRGHDKETAARIQSAHMANIGRLAAEGKIIMAGPMGYRHDADLRGIFIMDAKDSVTAASYVKTDSAIITGRLRFEVHPWWTQTGTYIFLSDAVFVCLAYFTEALINCSSTFTSTSASLLK